MLASLFAKPPRLGSDAVHRPAQGPAPDTGSRAARRPRAAVGQAARPRGGGRVARRARAAAALRLPDEDEVSPGLNCRTRRRHAGARARGGRPGGGGAPVRRAAVPAAAGPVHPARRAGGLPRGLRRPLDLLLYLIRKQNFNILDIPLADVTRQYLDYVEQLRRRNLELAAEYLLMAAMLIEIKSRMLLPPKKERRRQRAEDPRAELVRRLIEYEQIKLAAAKLDQLPIIGRDFPRAQIAIEQSLQPRFPDVHVADLRAAWAEIPQRAGSPSTTPSREQLSVRAHVDRAAPAAGQPLRVPGPVRPRAARRCWWSPSSPCSSFRASG